MVWPIAIRPYLIINEKSQYAVVIVVVILGGRHFMYGDSGRIRTCDLCFRKALLYPAELRSLWFFVFSTACDRLKDSATFLLL